MKWRRLVSVLLFFIFILFGGVFGYFHLEGWSLLDSLYMTVIVMTTIGFQEVYPLSQVGKLFTIAFSLLSYVTLAGSIGLLSSAIIEADLLGRGRRKRMLRNIKLLRNHVVVCGAGKVGAHVLDWLKRAKRPFVAVDKDQTALSSHTLEVNLTHYLQGDATKEVTLKEAGIEHARGLISCVRDDAVNLFICLTARSLNPNLRISSYVMDEENLSKFQMIGVDDVISGDFVIGERLTTSMLNENVSAFLERTNNIGADRFLVGDATVPMNSKIIGHSIREANIYSEIGVFIFAIKSLSDSDFQFNPPSETILQGGDILITFANAEKIMELENYLKHYKAKSV